jgi:hypothetical protein
MSTKKLDEYCEKIFDYLAFNFEKPHYLNQLKEELNESGIKISKPTLILHLKHLKEMKIIKKRKEGKQKYAISLNYDSLIDIEFHKKFHEELESLLKEREIFNTQTIERKVKIASACLYIIETNRLKYEILKTLEPQKNLEYTLSFQLIKNTLRQYMKNLSKACFESQTNAKQALNVIEGLEKNWHDAITEELAPT